MRALVLFILCFIPFVTEAQELTRVILDGESKLPVSFATVKVLNKPIGAIASEKGEFVLDLQETDTVLFTCVGYKPSKIRGKDISEVVLLHRKPNTLKKVYVRTNKVSPMLVLGFDKPDVSEKLAWRHGGDAQRATRQTLRPSGLIQRPSQKSHSGLPT